MNDLDDREALDAVTNDDQWVASWKEDFSTFGPFASKAEAIAYTEGMAEALASPASRLMYLGWVFVAMTKPELSSFPKWEGATK